MTWQFWAMSMLFLIAGWLYQRELSRRWRLETRIEILHEQLKYSQIGDSPGLKTAKD